jgi:hypothetical protein
MMVIPDRPKLTRWNGLALILLAVIAIVCGYRVFRQKTTLPVDVTGHALEIVQPITADNTTSADAPLSPRYEPGVVLEEVPQPEAPQPLPLIEADKRTILQQVRLSSVANESPSTGLGLDESPAYQLAKKGLAPLPVADDIARSMPNPYATPPVIVDSSRTAIEPSASR